MIALITCCFGASAAYFLAWPWVQNKRSSSGILHMCLHPHEQQQHGAEQPQPQNLQQTGAHAQPGGCGRLPHVSQNSPQVVPQMLAQLHMPGPSPFSGLLQPISSHVGQQSARPGHAERFGKASLTSSVQQQKQQRARQFWPWPLPLPAEPVQRPQGMQRRRWPLSSSGESTQRKHGLQLRPAQLKVTVILHILKHFFTQRPKDFARSMQKQRSRNL
mmetsp:Transcript_118560/g.308032  ORF Transcript_118560/g.308032 Transcript_118560/m.308032 type:complete len:217 (-) Transcript_118560:675-1325(-)